MGVGFDPKRSMRTGRFPGSLLRSCLPSDTAASKDFGELARFRFAASPCASLANLVVTLVFSDACSAVPRVAVTPTPCVECRSCVAGASVYVSLVRSNSRLPLFAAVVGENTSCFRAASSPDISTLRYRRAACAVCVTASMLGKTQPHPGVPQRASLQWPTTGFALRFL